MVTKEQFLRLVEITFEEMPILVEKIRYQIKPIDLKACYGSLSHKHLTIGIHDYFIEGKADSFKQQLYIASKLKLAAIVIDSYQQFNAGELYYALFSDNPELVNIFARMETPELISSRNNPTYPDFTLHMLQLALLGDYELLETKVQKLAKHGRKKDHKNIDFFTLLIQGDKVALESLIHEEANIKSADPLLENFMSFFACMESKICWFRGIEVQIDHPLVPMELMPIKPLAHYDDFLMPDWQSPKRTLFGRFFGMM